MYAGTGVMICYDTLLVLYLTVFLLHYYHNNVEVYNLKFVYWYKCHDLIVMVH